MLTKKESERGEREEEGAGDVLIKGNSEGLDQIILRNLVREDTAFDTEKMELTCPQRAVIPTVEDQSVVAKAVHANHRRGRGARMRTSLFIYRAAPAMELSTETRSGSILQQAGDLEML